MWVKLEGLAHSPQGGSVDKANPGITTTITPTSTVTVIPTSHTLTMSCLDINPV